MRRVHVIVGGEVQGVGYRYTMRMVAREAGVAGWVRNRRDGSVEAEIEGAPGQVDEDKLEMAIRRVVTLTPRGIRKHLGLNKPIYARTAADGHFGRQPDADGGFSWEKLDLVDALKREVA